MDLIVFVLCFIQFLQNTSTSIFAPFLPVEAQNKQIDTVWVGLLMGTQSLTYIFASYFAGKFLKVIGRRSALAFGFFLLTCQLLGMGSVYWAVDSISFLTLGFMAQICGGLGAGLNSTASLAVLTSHYPDEREKIMGLFEAATGLGFLFGPLIGAGLYAIGGYILPFYGLSMLYIILLPLIIYIARLIHEAEVAQQTQASADTLNAILLGNEAGETGGDKEQNAALSANSAENLLNSSNQNFDARESSCKTYNVKVELRNLLTEKRFMFGLFGQFFAYFALQFISPVLALRLADFGSTPQQNGVMFAIPSLIYVLHMPLVSLYTRYVSKRVVIVAGFALLSLSMLFVGNSTWLRIPETLQYTMVGLVLLGIGFSAIVVPIFPEMLEGVEAKYPLYSLSNELNDMAAGLFNASMGLGECIGPVFSGVINKKMGFTLSQEVLGVVIGLFTVIYFISCLEKNFFMPITEISQNEKAERAAKYQDFSAQRSCGAQLMDGDRSDDISNQVSQQESNKLLNQELRTMNNDSDYGTRYHTPEHQRRRARFAGPSSNDDEPDNDRVNTTTHSGDDYQHRESRTNVSTGGAALESTTQYTAVRSDCVMRASTPERQPQTSRRYRRPSDAN